MDSRGKRVVPPALKRLLAADAVVTRNFIQWGNELVPCESLRVHFKALEISCHGIPWFAFWVAFTWLFGSDLVQLQINMLLGLFTDIVMVAFAKAYFRRRRPVANTDDALGQLGPDVFSFPSGHASRAVFVTCFFIYLYPLPIYCVLPLLGWTSAICSSRILMNRHYALDVLGGMCFGLFNAVLISLLWLSDDSSRWLMSFLSDDKIDGGDYHV